MCRYIIWLNFYLEIAGCGSLDESAAIEVCGAEDIGSCITQFNKEDDPVFGTSNWSVERGCNSKLFLSFLILE